METLVRCMHGSRKLAHLERAPSRGPSMLPWANDLHVNARRNVSMHYWFLTSGIIHYFSIKNPFRESAPVKICRRMSKARHRLLIATNDGPKRRRMGFGGSKFSVWAASCGGEWWWNRAGEQQPDRNLRRCWCKKKHTKGACWHVTF